jgi:hypothetical protein
VVPTRRPTPGLSPIILGVLLAAGIAFSASLAWGIPDEVFYVGDGGVRALMCRQLASGHIAFDLDPPAEPWVRDLWNRGLYPFEPPFVYELRDRHYMVFPFVFPLVTAPFYALMGFRGLYAVPLLALWGTWISFVAISRAAALSGAATAAATAALIFGSPLTLYGAIYWEHTLAVCLAFAGLGLLIPLRDPAGRRGVAIGGVLLSLSGLVREELFCLVGLVALLFIASPWISPARTIGLDRHRLTALVSIGAGIAVFLVANFFVYRRPLGLHSVLGLEDFPAASRTDFAVGLLRYLAPEFFWYFPLAALSGLVAVPVFVRSRVVAPGASFWLGLAVAYLLGVVLMLPSTGGKQWSPRFLLVLVPMTCVLAGIALDAGLRGGRGSFRVGMLTAFGVLLFLGGWRNTIRGSADLKHGYARRAAALSAFRSLPSRNIAVSHQFISQQAEALLGDKDLFLTKSGRDLRMLAQTLATRGETSFAFVCDPLYPCGPITPATASIELPQGEHPIVRLTETAAVDRYVIYEGRVLAAASKGSAR